MTRLHRILSHLVVITAIAALFSGYLLAGADLVAWHATGQQLTCIDWMGSTGATILGTQTGVLMLLWCWLAGEA